MKTKSTRLPRLIGLARRVTVEFGTHGYESRIDDLRILYLDNHVNPNSQTFRFYIPFVNEVIQDRQEDANRRFRTWRFKPGNAVHVLIPVEKFEQQFVLPIEAVVQDGVEAFVFRLLEEGDDHGHSHGGHSHGDHSHEGHAHDDHSHGDEKKKAKGDEFQRVPVHIVYQDTTVAVIASDDVLKTGHKVVMNNAYQLLLAMKAATGGGHVGHDHGHAH